VFALDLTEGVNHFLYANVCNNNPQQFTFGEWHKWSKYGQRKKGNSSRSN